MIRGAAVLALPLLLASAVHARSAQEWKSRVIYQLLTDRFAGSQNPCSDLHNYCGGTFQGLISRLDYIQGLGANAIWISPIPLQTDGGFHGYWQRDITKINPNFGNSSDLARLVQECHKRDIWVMLDVVANHVGPQNPGDWSNFSPYNPFNQEEHYHPYCLIQNFNNQTEVEVCRLANLPDLDQNNDFVRSTLKDWIHSTIQQYNFDGIRIDTTPEVHPDFWSEYSSSAGVYSVGEVFNGNPQYTSQYQGPLDATLNYPMYYKLYNAFQKRQSLRNLHDGVTANKQYYHDVSVLANFLDNHDNPRFLSVNPDQNALKNALAYVIFAEGIPIIYYGTEQAFNGAGDPQNRETLWPHYDNSSSLYQAIAVMTAFRRKVGSSLYEAAQVESYVDDQFFAFYRGQVLVAVSNGQSPSRTISTHPYSEGTTLVNVLDSSDTVTVSNGQFQISLNNNLPKVYYPSSNARRPQL